MPPLDTHLAAQPATIVVPLGARPAAQSAVVSKPPLQSSVAAAQPGTGSEHDDLRWFVQRRADPSRHTRLALLGSVASSATMARSLSDASGDEDGGGCGHSRSSFSSGRVLDIASRSSPRLCALLASTETVRTSSQESTRTSLMRQQGHQQGHLIHRLSSPPAVAPCRVVR